MKVKRTVDFKAWIDSLRDLAGRARIQARIERLAGGNAGDHRHLGDGISELRVNAGPGYRVYYHLHGDVLILLLSGGNKSTQQADIAKAKRLLRTFLEQDS